MAYLIPKYYLYKRIIDSKIYIDEHFSEDLDLEQLAEVSCFSKYHYIKLFKEAYGVTPIQYLKKKRFAQAIILMKSAMATIDICHEVGYTSVYTFTNEFRRIKGMTPKEYRIRYYHSLNDRTEVPQCFLNKSQLRNFE